MANEDKKQTNEFEIKETEEQAQSPGIDDWVETNRDKQSESDDTDDYSLHPLLSR